MVALEIVVGLLLVAIALTLLAARLSTPRPIILAIGGLLLGFIWRLSPGAPAIEISPETVLAIFLPPVLAWASFSVPLGAFRENLRWIVLLAVGLVLVTMILVATIARALEPTIPWAALLALGALLAPPDPVAATSIAGGLGLRNRLVAILDGEGLINDAISIVLFHIAISAAVTGQFSWLGALLDLARTAPIGVVTGLAVGAIVVAMGLYLRRDREDIEAPSTRLISTEVWETVDFIIEALIFLIVGAVLADLDADLLTLHLLWQGALIAAAAIGIRIAWMHLVPRVVYLISPPDNLGPATPAERTILGWAGMRGVVSLALAPLIHYLSVGDPGAEQREERVARRGAIRAAAREIDEILRLRDEGSLSEAVARRLDLELIRLSHTPPTK